MDDEKRRWFGTCMKGACALILLFGIPTGYFSSYADNIIDFLTSITGEVPDGIAKIFYIFAPFFIVEVACTGIMVFIARSIKRHNEIKEVMHFNGFYRWKSSRKEKGSNDDAYHLLYISNTCWDFVLSLVGRWQPTIRYWRCSNGKIIVGEQMEFHYDIMFQRRRLKRSKQTVSKKDTVILIGSDDVENIIFKCSLVANNEKALQIVTYRETMSSHKSNPIENNKTIYKQLSHASASKQNQIIHGIISNGDLICSTIAEVTHNKILKNISKI